MPHVKTLYTPRTPLEDNYLFKNYSEEIAEIEGDLLRPGAAYALVGGPGMAKSSILKRIKRDLIEQLSTSASRVQPALMPVYIKLTTPLNVTEPLRLRGLLNKMMGAILEELHTVISDLRFDTSRLRITRLSSKNWVEEDHEDFFNDLWELVMEVERLVGQAKLVLLIDELGCLASDRSLRVFFARFLLEFVDPDSMYSRKTPRSYAAMVLACDRDLPEILPTQQGKALGAFIKPKYLSTLDRESSFRLIQEPIEEAVGILLPPDVIEEVHLQTGGHPCLIHSVMHELCARGDLQAITAETVRENLPGVADSLTDIAAAIQSYVDEDPLADLVFAVIYKARLSLLLKQIVEALPPRFHGSHAFRVQKTLRMLASLGVVRIINEDGFKRYESTGEIFRTWFDASAMQDKPEHATSVFGKKRLDEANSTLLADNHQGESSKEKNILQSLETASQSPVNTPVWPRKHPFSPNILVMKGGGIKGLAYVGALKVLEDYGYQFTHYVGTSAGAISAALLAVGYSPTELGEILATTNFKKFKDGWLLFSLPLLIFRKGLYRGEVFRVWLENHLRAKFPQFASAVDIRFSHLAQMSNGLRRLSVFASLKGQSAYCFDSNNPANSNDLVSFACRCSMAIPYFFRPERIAGKWAVDGGMQNNYPIYSLLISDPSLRDSADFLGLYLGHKNAERSTQWLLLDLFAIWSESGDEEAKTQFIDRTVIIDPRPVKTTDFSLSQDDVKFLLAEGRASALRWLYHWGDSKRPPIEVVTDAERRSSELRTIAIAKRWRRFLPKLVLIVLILLVTAVYVALRSGILFYW
jgi:hypothetical protein